MLFHFVWSFGIHMNNCEFCVWYPCCKQVIKATNFWSVSTQTLIYFIPYRFLRTLFSLQFFIISCFHKNWDFLRYRIHVFLLVVWERYILLLLKVGLNIFYSEEKDWTRHKMRQCPLQTESSYTSKTSQFNNPLHYCATQVISYTFVVDCSSTIQFAHMVSSSHFHQKICFSSSPLMTILFSLHSCKFASAKSKIL